MKDFVHLHVHTQYSILDGQASIPKLVDKALKDGMRGMAITDHGNMMGIKEFFNYVNKVKGKAKGKLAECEEKLANATPEERPAIEKDMEAQKAVLAFKPIFGCEMYVARHSKTDMNGKEDMSGYHLIVLAKNYQGYHNLIKLVSNAWTDGFYMRPRTDRADIEKYHEGLIVCSACIAGEVPRRIHEGNIGEAEEAARWYHNLFGDDYYLEMQRHKVTDPEVFANREAYPVEQEVNAELVKIADKLGIKLICTNDVHFVDAENAEAHDRLICLSTGKDLNDRDRLVYTKQEWFKTRKEMNALFEDFPHALENTCEICDKVETYSIDHAPIMPNFEIPEEFGTEDEYRRKYTEEDLFNEFTRDENGNVVCDEEEGKKKIKKLGGYDKLYRIKLEADYLAKLTYEKAAERYGDPLPDDVKERLKFELHIMKTMGFPGYFLIVQDYINAARNELGVWVGPGRGSAAGSAVAYCLGITQIDPIKYDLLFERFLNPDRISLPDIDVDFDDDGRGEVLSWVTKKYGFEKVAHIITYGTMATKLALKDVARVQKLPLETSNRLCKLIPDKLPEGPDGKVPKMNLPNAIAAIPELREAAASSDPLLSSTLKYAVMLEGNVRNTGVHACGIIICRDAISDWVPISTAEDKATHEKLICTQYEGSVIEETGLIKMDFLGLKTLSILKEAVENVKLSRGIEIDIDNVPIDDPATFKLYQEGKTVGTFQFESAGMQKYLRELKPTTFEDLIAMNALYRPGPMSYIPQFIARKHGVEPIQYDIPCMEKYLKDTYGITVYQEQVMLLSRQLAGFTRGESDTLRKAMGKKQIEKLNHLYPKFIAGGQKNGYDKEVLEKIWNDWRAFASYAFNKSHATCYSWVAYQTAYLKANYPPEYMAAVMSRSLSDISEIRKLMDESKAMGIQTLSPDVNESNLKFGVNSQGNIRFGLAAIKGMGFSAAENIIEERRKNGPFKSIFDFVQRINMSIFNRKSFECLATSGALDCFGLDRGIYMATGANGETFMDVLIKYGSRYQQEKADSKNTLFGDMGSFEIPEPDIPAAYPKWSDIEKLEKERELVGIYLSGHPLDAYGVILENICNTHFNDLENLAALAGRELILGGIVTDVREGIGSKGKPYGIIRFEDFESSGEIPFWGNSWARWGNYLKKGYTVLITANVQPRRYNDKMFDINVKNIEFLADVKTNDIESITINTFVDRLDDVVVNDLIAMIDRNPGKTNLYFNIIDINTHTKVKVHSRAKKVKVERSLLEFIKKSDAFEYKIN